MAIHFKSHGQVVRNLLLAGQRSKVRVEGGCQGGVSEVSRGGGQELCQSWSITKSVNDQVGK